MQTFKPFDKVIINRGFEPENGRIIGIKPEQNGQQTYFVELLRKDFAPHVYGSKIIRVSPSDMAMNIVRIGTHKTN